MTWIWASDHKHTYWYMSKGRSDKFGPQDGLKLEICQHESCLHCRGINFGFWAISNGSHMQPPKLKYNRLIPNIWYVIGVWCGWFSPQDRFKRKMPKKVALLVELTNFSFFGHLNPRSYVAHRADAIWQSFDTPFDSCQIYKLNNPVTCMFCQIYKL